MRKITIENNLQFSTTEYDGRYPKCTNAYVLINNEKYNIYLKGRTGSVKVGPRKNQRVFIMYENNVLSIFNSPREYNKEKDILGISGTYLRERNYSVYDEKFINSIKIEYIGSSLNDKLIIRSGGIYCTIAKGFKTYYGTLYETGKVQIKFGKYREKSIYLKEDETGVFKPINTNSLHYEAFIEF